MKIGAQWAGGGARLRQTQWDLRVSGQVSCKLWCLKWDLKDEWVITGPSIQGRLCQALNPSRAGPFFLPQTKLSLAGVLGIRWQVIKGETSKKRFGSPWYKVMKHLDLNLSPCECSFWWVFNPRLTWSAEYPGNTILPAVGRQDWRGTMLD